MKILFLSRWYPFPPNNGSKLRIRNLLAGLEQRHEVTLLTFIDPTELVKGLGRGDELEGRAVQVVPWRPFNPGRLRAQLGYFRATPRSVIDTYSTEMAAKIQQALASTSYDLVIASQVDMAVYSPLFGRVPAMLEECETGALYAQYAGAHGVWPRLRHGLTWLKHRHYVASRLKHFKVCTVASSKEKEILHTHVMPHPHVEIIPNPVDVKQYRGIGAAAKPNTLVFTGAFTYAPNFAAMQWFVEQVFPLVRRQVPDVQLVITGDHAGRFLAEPAGVTLAGYVDDVRPLVAAATVSLAPILSGGGTRIKILEAMALRTPVVATSKGAEGLAVVHGEHLLIADTPQDFAAAVIAYLGSPELRTTIAENAYRLVCARYDTATVVPTFLRLIEQIVVH